MIQKGFSIQEKKFSSIINKIQNFFLIIRKKDFDSKLSKHLKPIIFKNLIYFIYTKLYCLERSYKKKNNLIL